MKETLKYRVGVENSEEHIDFWFYTAREYKQAMARYESIKLEEGQSKYIINLLTDEVICFVEK